MRTNNLHIIENITLQDVLDAKPEKIWFSSGTLWWTHDPDHIKHVANYLERTHKINEDYYMDPSGAPLHESTKPKEFIKDAKANPDRYGEMGIRAFMATHHANSFQAEDHTNSMVCSNRYRDYERSLLINDGKFVYPESPQPFQTFQSEVTREFYVFIPDLNMADGKTGEWSLFNMNLALNAHKLLESANMTRSLQRQYFKSSKTQRAELLPAAKEAEKRLDDLISVLNKSPGT